ncbi:5420_t:CDS:2, partial [Rhizophagus irregularis]
SPIKKNLRDVLVSKVAEISPESKKNDKHAKLKVIFALGISFISSDDTKGRR